MNSVTTDNLVELITFQGEEYLFYKSFKLDGALSGTIADENGNISFTREHYQRGTRGATAAKNSGGIVIVQVEYVANAGTLNPKEVKIPGVLVDYVVQATSKDACWQTEGVYFEPAFPARLKSRSARLRSCLLTRES